MFLQQKGNDKRSTHRVIDQCPVGYFTEKNNWWPLKTIKSKSLYISTLGVNRTNFAVSGSIQQCVRRIKKDSRFGLKCTKVFDFLFISVYKWIELQHCLVNAWVLIIHTQKHIKIVTMLLLKRTPESSRWLDSPVVLRNSVVWRRIILQFYCVNCMQKWIFIHTVYLHKNHPRWHRQNRMCAHE